jgi:uncharacterized protein
MNSETYSVKPLSAESRISIIDALRGIALCGILLMNIPFFGKSYHLYYNLEILKEYTGANYYCWWMVNGLFEGTMRGIFSMLFGAGSFLLLDRLEKKNLDDITPADIYYRRLIWLLIFGLVNAYIFLWPGDILYTYAITGLFLYPFRKLAAAKLLAFGLLFMFLSTLQHTSKLQCAYEKRVDGMAALAKEKKGKVLSEEEKGAKEAWKEFQNKLSIGHKKKEIKVENEKRKKGYAAIFEEMEGVNKYIETKDFYTELFLDALGFFLVGMALFKWGFLSGQMSLGLYMVSALLFYGLGLPLSFWMHKNAILHKFDFSLAYDDFPFSVYQLRRILLALGHISLVMIIFKINFLNWILKGFSAVGQMAFTNYLSQTLICGFVFNGYGLAQFGLWERYQLYQFTAGVWVFQIAFSLIWLRFFQFGPFEWLWRSLTYWKPQPMLK